MKKATLILFSLLSLAFLCSTQGVNETYFQSYDYPNHRIRPDSSRVKITELMIDGNFTEGAWKIVPGLADPTWISFESTAYPGRYLRHRNLEIWLDSPDGSLLFKKDATFKIVPGLVDKDWISFEAYAPSGYYLRHIGYELWLAQYDGTQPFNMSSTFRKTQSINSLAKTYLQPYRYPTYRIRHQYTRGIISTLLSSLDKKDGAWLMVPGLADPTWISIESTNYPGTYLRHKNSEVWQERDDGSEKFRNTSTFKIVPGLANSSWMSFEAFNEPGYYLKHSGNLLYISKTDESQLSKMDATFQRTMSYN